MIQTTKVQTFKFETLSEVSILSEMYELTNNS